MAIVNYQMLNIGEMLHLLPCNLLRNNVRAIEKLNKRFINAKYGKKILTKHVSLKSFSLNLQIYIYIYVYIYIFNNTLNYYIFTEFHNKCNSTKHFL